MMKDKSTTKDDQNGAAPANAQQDVAGLYSWANLEGSKYRDFSESRQQARAQTRQRGQLKSPPAVYRDDPGPLAPPLLPKQISAIRRQASEKSATPPMPPQMGPRVLPSPASKVNQRSASRESPRWMALKTVFDHEEQASPKEAPPSINLDIPCVALVSLAGGVGKTTLVASLSRSLSAGRQNVLVVDTQSYGLLPLFFGAREVGLGNIRTFSCGQTSAPISVMTVDPEMSNPGSPNHSHLVEQIAQHAEGMHSVLIDVASGSTAILREILRLAPTVLFVLTPDMASMTSLQALQALLQATEEETSSSPRLYYVLNRFDESLPLHDYVREILSAQLGDRLLPFVLHHSNAVSEALAEGASVFEYAPRSEIVQDLKRLSLWAIELGESAIQELPEIRWGER